MSKLKFYKKWQSESEPYSPSHEWEKEEQFDVKNLSLEEPSSSLSSYSLTFDGEKWIIPLDDDDMEADNFLPPRTSSPKPGKPSLY